jgi:hypothetical protein
VTRASDPLAIALIIPQAPRTLEGPFVGPIR